MFKFKFKIDKKIIHNKLTIYVVFLFSFLFLIWRAKYGFCFNDEPFCITLGQRIYNGDALIVDEWHGVQNFGTVILPFYSFFRIFSLSNEGIILTFRYIYCLLWILTCIAVYKVLKPYKIAALTVFLYLILFSPLDYMTISYTSISLMASLLICCITYYIINNQKTSVFYVLSFSFLWIILVLCSPFMAAAYIIFVFMAFIASIYKKHHNTNFNYGNLLYICKLSIPIITVVAIIYLYLFLISQSDIKTILLNIPFVLQDPEHSSSLNPIVGIKNIILLIYQNSPFFCKVSIIAFVAGLTNKLSPKLRLLIFIICSVIFIQEQSIFFTEPMAPLFNYQMINIVILGAVACSLIQNKPLDLLFSFGLFGCLYTIFNNITSNTGLMSIAMSLTVCGVFSIFCILQLLKEFAVCFNKVQLLKTAGTFTILLVITIQLSSQLYIRLNRTYWDGQLSSLNTQITCGAAKGLYTTPANAEKYENIYNNLKHLLSTTDTRDKTFLSCTSAPYIYLDADLDFATFSAWSFGYGENLNGRILDYQSLNPDKVPDIIFCYTEADILPLTQNGYSVNEYNGSYLFVKSD